jgi:hypothetical protein
VSAVLAGRHGYVEAESVVNMPWCGQTGCRTRAVVTWEASGPNGYRSAGACANPRHGAKVQAWVAGVGTIKVTAGDPEYTWPDPDAAQLALDLGVA